jgi:hypothetical protein
MAGQGGGGRTTLWVALIGFLGLVVGAVISGYFSYRGSNLAAVQYEVDATRTAEASSLDTIKETVVFEVTRLVEAEPLATVVEEKEVTRTIEVTREVEVTHSVIVTQISEVTRIVEIYRDPPRSQQ